MAAEVARIPRTRPAVGAIVEAVLPSRSMELRPPVPFPSPLLHPNAVEALLLAFGAPGGEHGRR